MAAPTRNTKQRAAIEGAIVSAAGPLSPAEVHEVAGAQVENLGLATVYRAINRLLEDGVIKAVEIPGEGPRYEAADLAHHHHFHCDACGRVFDFEGCPGDLAALAPEGFSVRAHEIVLYGRCAACGS
ncbi:MAG: transcriptional repressor [Planctomycetota bacterium]